MLIRRFLRAIEPWYDWGKAEIHRLDMHCRDFADESYGPVWFVELQWLGAHFALQIGRTPRRISEAEIAACRDARASRQEAARARGDDDA